MATIFQDVGGLKPQRTKFNLGYSNRYNCNMGELIPSYVERAEAGDIFSIGQEVLCRLQPLVSPVLDNLYISTEYFFVPLRLLWDKWEDYITGIKKDTVPPEEFTDPQPEWTPATSINGTLNNSKFSLWDYFGFPINVDPVGSYPLDYLRRAYNFIYNEWYRDENLQELVDLKNDKILYRSWRKDYFTSALPFRQKGVAPSVPITGMGQVDFSTLSSDLGETAPIYSHFSRGPSSGPGPSGWSQLTTIPAPVANQRTDVYFDTPLDMVSTPFEYLTSYNGLAVPPNHLNNYPSQALRDANAGLLPLVSHGDTNEVTNSVINFSNWLKRNSSIDLSNVGTFNVSDLRDLFQLQIWMERNARAGTRYITFLKAHYGVSPSDARLDRPEFLGSIKSSVIISEVLQTSSSTTSSAQGNLAGKGLGVSKNYIERYYVEEPGVIIGLTCVYPRPSYQQGINRVWLRKSRLEQFYPEFVNLSEQGIKQAELYATNNADENNKIFGFTGIYDEMRVRQPQVCGDLRDTLDYWVMTRKFNTSPSLNSEFITCKPSKNIFAVQDEPGVILNIYNDITAIRSIPYISEPGLIDHH